MKIKQFCQLMLSLMPYVFAVLVAIVTVLLLIELPPKQGGWPYWDKVQHIAVFCAMTMTGYLAYPRRKLRVAASLTAFGGLMEILQGLLTITREASVFDWMADVVGIVLVTGMFMICLKKQF
jgi:VanZ family protein